MLLLPKPSLPTVTVILLCAVPAAWSAAPPADPCTLLSPAEVAKAVGKAYSAPKSNIAPRPFANTNYGTDCIYSPTGDGKDLTFRIYFDPTPAASTELFARLKKFYSPATPAAGVGDEAYFDPQHAIHVRKGNARYYLDLGGSAAAEKPLQALAILVAGKL